MRIRAYAKVNLGLAVTNKRADGFHDIDTIFALIDLFDTLRIERFPSNKIYLSVRGANLATNEDNLVYKAAQSYLEATNEIRGVTIELEKSIPISAGLGGGSSDAAATLIALSKIYPSNLDLNKIALGLGSDVTFFLSTFKAARARARGELLDEIKLKKQNILLVNPNIAVSAKDAYQNLEGLDNKLKINKIIKQLNNYEIPEYYNSLQPGVLRLEPKIAELLEILDKNLSGVLMSGSGSTCFGLGSANDIDLARAKLEKIYPKYWFKTVETL